MLVIVFCCLQTFESEEQEVDQNKTVTTEKVKTLGGGEQEKSTDKELQVRIYLNELVLLKITYFVLYVCFSCRAFNQAQNSWW